jgi:N-acetylneuraminic acid mutarotase
LLVWGGTTGQAATADGAAYDPARDKWHSISPSPLAPRTASVSAWTGKELLVWGGNDLADGAAYDPAADRWRPLAAGPLAGRSAAVSAWTGREMVVWGGVTLNGNREFADGAAYDPATDRWRPIASSPLSGRYTPATVWTGNELLVWGGNAPGAFPFGDGAAYDPATDRWRPLPATTLAPRSGAAAVWTGKDMIVWGGVGAPPPAGGLAPLDQVLQLQTSQTPLNDGAVYDPASDSWRPLESVKLLGRAFPIAVWDGKGMIVWGGLVAVDAPASASDGVRYAP